jgi:hypothetical protein
MAEERSPKASTPAGTTPGRPAPRADEPWRAEAEARPDLEGVRVVSEDVGSLPVPRTIQEERAGKPLPRALQRAVPPRSGRPATGPAPAGEPTREEEARLRRTLPHAARTPEELGRALSRAGQEGVRDPQAGREAGPPLPGEPGYHGDT